MKKIQTLTASAPLSYIYAAAVNARNLAYDSIPALSKPLGRPAVSVGGIRAGGTGKTPAALLVGQYIMERGYAPAFLSRGYGRLSRKPVVVKPREPADWELTGDEPCMLHENLPESWLGVGADRNALAAKLSPLLPEKSAFILDDGFQRRQTRRDLNIVCISENTFDDRLMPAGYLREPVSSLARADIVFIIGQEGNIGKLREVKEAVERRFAPLCAVLLQYPRCWVNGETGETTTSAPLKNPAVICGIARPERFVETVRAFSIEPIGIYNFRDHYNFKKNDFVFAHDIYSNGAVTTEKDFIRLRSKKFAPWRELWYLKTGLRFSDEGSEALVKSKINGITP